MTRKDYQLIADCIVNAKAQILPEREAYVDIVVDELVRALQADNPRFDSTKFYRATRAR